MPLRGHRRARRARSACARLGIHTPQALDSHGVWVPAFAGDDAACGFNSLFVARSPRATAACAARSPRPARNCAACRARPRRAAPWRAAGAPASRRAARRPTAFSRVKCTGGAPRFMANSMRVAAVHRQLHLVQIGDLADRGRDDRRRRRAAGARLAEFGFDVAGLAGKGGVDHAVERQRRRHRPRPPSRRRVRRVSWPMA